MCKPNPGYDELVDVDVLVVGAGGAGLRAALEATEFPACVAVVNKGVWGKSGCTAVLEGGYDAAFGLVDEDNPALHFKDTVEGGGYINNQVLARILTEEGPRRLLELEKYGALFERDERGMMIQRSYGGHRYHRVIPHGDWAGREVLTTLMDESLKRGVQVFNEVMVTGLLTSDGRVVGAVGLSYGDGRYLVFRAKSTVLATGGGGWIYGVTTNPVDKTGDGFALAYGLGAEFVDMEFVQFYPTGFVYPPALRGVLSREPGRFAEFGAVLLNAKGERFMGKYDPRWEKATRALVARAIFNEIVEGRGTGHGGVYHDFTQVPLEVMESEMASWYELCMLAGIDPKKEPVEVAPTCHHFMGGVRINERCESTIPGLYACGEVAGGIHGANRLGGNAFPDIIVFGARAGKNAAEHAMKTAKPTLPVEQVDKNRREVSGILEREDGVSPIKAKKNLQEVMWSHVGVRRSGDSLRRAVSDIQKMRGDILPKLAPASKTTRYNYEWVEALEFRGMLDISEVIARAALMRTESREAHWREDYPQTDNGNWLKNIVAKSDGGRVSLWTVPCVMTDVLPLRLSEQAG